MALSRLTPSLANCRVAPARVTGSEGSPGGLRELCDANDYRVLGTQLLQSQMKKCSTSVWHAIAAKLTIRQAR